MSLKQNYCDFEAKLGYILSGQPELDREILGRVERNPNLSQLILRLRLCTTLILVRTGRCKWSKDRLPSYFV